MIRARRGVTIRHEDEGYVPKRLRHEAQAPAGPLLDLDALARETAHNIEQAGLLFKSAYEVDVCIAIRAALYRAQEGR